MILTVREDPNAKLRDDIDDIGKYIADSAIEFNRQSTPWTWTAPLREGTAGIIQQFVPDNDETERLQSLVGLDDNQFAEAVRAGKVEREEWPLGRMPQERRDAILKGKIAQRQQWGEAVNQAVDYVLPQPHRDPEGILENVGDYVLKVAPQVALTLIELKTLGLGGTTALNTLLGHRNTQQQVYANLRAQGYSPNEARHKAMEPLTNLADLGINAGTNYATLSTLGTPITTTGAASPVAQTLGNIARAGLYSGAGTYAQQRLTNYRSEIEDNPIELLKTSGKAALGTGLMGLMGAALRGSRLWQLQKEYYNNRPIEAESWVKPNNEPPMLGAGDTPQQPRNNPPSSGGNALALPEPSLNEQAAGLARYNNAVTRRGFTPITSNSDPSQSFAEIRTAIQNGNITPVDANAMLVEGGIAPEIAQLVTSVQNAPVVTPPATRNNPAPYIDDATSYNRGRTMGGLNYSTSSIRLIPKDADLPREFRNGTLVITDPVTRTPVTVHVQHKPNSQYIEFSTAPRPEGDKNSAAYQVAAVQNSEGSIGVYDVKTNRFITDPSLKNAPMLSEVKKGFSENIPDFYAPSQDNTADDVIPPEQPAPDEPFIPDTELPLNDMDEEDVSSPLVRRRIQPARPEQINTPKRNTLPNENAPANFSPYKGDTSLLPFDISPKNTGIDKTANVDDFTRRPDLPPISKGNDDTNTFSRRVDKTPSYGDEDNVGISDFTRIPDIPPIDKGNEDTHKFRPEPDKIPTNKRFRQDFASEGGTSTPTGSNTDRARTMRGTEVDIQYRIVDADDLIVSTNEDGGANPDFPPELQPRQRDRQASHEQIDRMASHIDPELLGRNRLASDGAPIIGSDMVVESGNGRVMALRQAYRRGMGEIYRKWLHENASQFGLSREDFDGVRNPVLVRERISPVDRVRFASEANESSTAGMSPTENAQEDARKITSAMLSLYDPERSLQGNHDFLRGFFSVIPQSERGSFMQQDGSISRAGIERAKNALTALAYGDNSILNRLNEFFDDDIKNISNALVQAAPKLALLERSRHRPDISLRRDIMQAVNTLAYLRQSGQSVEGGLAQLNLFAEDNLSDEAKELIRFFDRNKRSAKRVAQGLINYADIASGQPAPNQILIPGTEDSVRDKGEMLKQAIAQAEEREYVEPQRPKANLLPFNLGQHEQNKRAMQKKIHKVAPTKPTIHGFRPEGEAPYIHGFHPDDRLSPRMKRGVTTHGELRRQVDTHTLPLDDPRLQPPVREQPAPNNTPPTEDSTIELQNDISKQFVPAPAMDEDGFLGYLNVYSSVDKRIHTLSVFADEEDGLPYIDLANAKGDSIAFYTPIDDVFTIREEYSRIGWVRYVEDVLRDNLDDIFDLAGIDEQELHHLAVQNEPEEDTPQDVNLTPMSALEPQPEVQQSKPKAPSTTLSKAGEAFLVQPPRNASKFLVTPMSDGSFKIDRITRLNAGGIDYYNHYATFSNGTIQKQSGSLNETDKFIEQAILEHNKQQNAGAEQKKASAKDISSFTLADKIDEDGLVGTIRVHHDGEVQEFNAYFDEFVDDERSKVYGKYFVSVTDNDNHDVGSYMPAVNFFDAEKQFKHSELANSIASTLNENTDDIFRLAGIDPKEGMKKNVSERTKRKPSSKTAPKVDNFLDAVKTGNVSEIIEGNEEKEPQILENNEESEQSAKPENISNEAEDESIDMPDTPFEFSAGWNDYKAVPDSDGRLEITRLIKSKGITVAEATEGLYFYDGELHRLDVHGNDLGLSSRDREVEQAIKSHLKQHSSDNSTQNTPNVPKTEDVLTATAEPSTKPVTEGTNITPFSALEPEHPTTSNEDTSPIQGKAALPKGIKLKGGTLQVAHNGETYTFNVKAWAKRWHRRLYINGPIPNSNFSIGYFNANNGTFTQEFNALTNDNPALFNEIKKAFLEHINEFYETGNNTSNDIELGLSDKEKSDLEKGIIPHRFRLRSGTVDVSGFVIPSGRDKGEIISKGRGKFRVRPVKGHRLLRFTNEGGVVAYEYDTDSGRLDNYKGGGIYEDIMPIVEREFKENIKKFLKPYDDTTQPETTPSTSNNIVQQPAIPKGAALKDGVIDIEPLAKEKGIYDYLSAQMQVRYYGRYSVTVNHKDNTLSFTPYGYRNDPEQYRLFVYEPDTDAFIMYDEYNPDRNAKIMPLVEEVFRQNISDFYSIGGQSEQATPPADNEESSPEPVSSQKIDASQKVAEWVKQRVLETLENDDAEIALISNRDLLDIADEAFGGTKGEGKYSPKDAYDAMELGINMAIKSARRGSMFNFNALRSKQGLITAFEALDRILQLIPTQANRTEKQVEFQQFSTPPTLALLVNWLANIFPNQNVLEPSAGIGGLAVFAHNLGANLILNELDDGRANLLDRLNLEPIYGEAFRENAEHIHANLIRTLTEEELPNRVVMNPPFSSTAGRTKKHDAHNAQPHIEEAMKLMKDNGRLVVILSKSMSDDNPSFSSFWKHIRKKYNVRAIIKVDGSAYKKYGTTWGNIIAVIDKNGSTPENGTLHYSFNGSFSDRRELEKLINALEDVQADIPDAEIWSYEDTPAHITDDEENTDVDYEPETESADAEEPTEKTPATSKTTVTLNPDNFLESGMLHDGHTPEVFKQAFDELNDGSNLVFLPDLYNKLQSKHWNGVEVSRIIELLHDNGDVSLSNNHDEELDTPTLMFRTFMDKNGFTYTHISWNNGSTPNNKPNNSPSSGTHKPSTDETSGNAETKPGVSAPKPATSKPASSGSSLTEKTSPRSSTKSSAKPQTEKPAPSTEEPPKRGHKKKSEDTQPQGGHSIEELQSDTSEVKLNVKHANERLAEEKEDAEAEEDRLLNENDLDAPDTQEISINSRYRSTVTGFAPHPGLLDESTAMKSVPLPKPSYIPKLPAEVQEKGLLSEAQIEPVIYAGQAFRYKNDNGERRGYFIADGTGVGKGREISAIIMDALAHGYGKGKALWISDKHSLVKDARRDWAGLGNNPEDIRPHEKTTPAQLQKLTQGVLFSAYSYFSGRGSQDRINNLKEWLGDGFDGVIVLDECHNVNNVLGKNASKAAVNVRDFIKAFPEARILYVSATGATEVQNLAMLDRLGLWGGNHTPFVNAEDFATAISKGGTAAMELVARDLKAMGLFCSRTLSMEGIKFRTLEAPLNEHRKAIYDKLAECWQKILQNIDAALELCGGDEAKNGAKGRALMQFWNAHQRFFNQIMLTLQTPAMIKDIEHQLAEGNSIVIQLTNTFEQAQENAVDTLIEKQSKFDIQDTDGRAYHVEKQSATKEHKVRYSVKPETPRNADERLGFIFDEDGLHQADERQNIDLSHYEDIETILRQHAEEAGEIDYEDLDISPKQVMLQFLNASFPVDLLEEVEDDEGHVRTVKVTDSQGRPIVSPEAVALRDQLVAEVNSIKQFPESPLELLIDHFGADAVAEVTGRSRRFIRNENGKRVQENRSNSKIQGEVNDFNAGRRRILIFSEKGGTGASYHASNDYENKQKRIHYLFQPGWRSDKAMQGLGRTHRSNEAQLPEYVLVTTDIPGQKRFISTIARRLQQLGALSTGERKSNTRGLFSENDNLEQSYVHEAMIQMFKKLVNGYYPEFKNVSEVFQQLGFNVENFNSPKTTPQVTRFLNRILSMTVDMQKKLFARFEEEIDERRGQLKNAGLLDMRTEDVRAKSINILQEEIVYTSREYGTETKYLELELIRAQKPRPFTDVIKKGAKDFYVVQETGEVVAAVARGGAKTDVDTGEVTQKFTLYFVDPKRIANTSDSKLNNRSPNQQRHYTKLSMSEAQKLWETQAGELSPTYSETKHMITGAILPIWKRFGESNVRVQRVKTSDGREFLGRLIADKDLKTVLSRLNIRYGSSKKYTPASLRRELDAVGKAATLANNIKLKYSRVNGEKRLEIIDADFYMMRRLVELGAIKEIISSTPRLFVRTGDDKLIEYLLNDYPVISISAGESNNNSNLYFIPPSFRFTPDDNPYTNTSNYAFSDPETEKRYQASKKPKKRSLTSILKEAAAQVINGFRSDLPGLLDDDRLIRAQELLRKLKRERKADVQESIRRLHAALSGLTPDDFDLFSRAMQLMDLVETRELDPDAGLPWCFNDDTLYMDYQQAMRDVDNNIRVSDAINKAEALGRDLSDKLIQAADELQMFDIKDKLQRKHYFRHVVLDYYQQAKGGVSKASVRNPERRGYLKHREGSEKDILSDWIMAMGEVWTRMNGDIKILHTLKQLRKEYDIIEDLKEQAFRQNQENALYAVMATLKDIPPSQLRAKAAELLEHQMMHKQAQSIDRLFKLAEKGDLPTGENHEWAEFVHNFAKAGSLERLDDFERELLPRYIGWLAGRKRKSRARAAAQRFLKGDTSKQAGLKKILGDKYIHWQDLIPDDYELWSPSDSRLVFSANTVPENVLLLAQENLDELLGIPLSEIGKALNSGGNKQLWCIPAKLADTLNALGKSQAQGMLARGMRKAMTAFKRWILLTPANGRIIKYNWRNFFGDLEAVLQGNPGALYYLRQACSELTNAMLRGQPATGMLYEFNKRGGGLTSEFINELENWEDLKEFAHLFEQKKSINPLKMGVNMFKGYIKIATTLTNFRENILRYAAFLSYVKLIQENNGEAPFYGMSKPKEVKALSDDVFDMAFKLANENLGAYDQVSQNTQWLRDNSWLSFISFVEVNFKRHIQMYKNIWSGNSYLEYWLKKHGEEFINRFAGGNGGGKKPPKDTNGNDWADDDDISDNMAKKLFKRLRRMFKKAPAYALRFAITLALSAPLMLICAFFNWLNGENDEKLTPEVRNTPHLTLNTNERTGEVMYFSRLGSAVDFFETLGLDGITRDVRDIWDGSMSVLELPSKIISGPVSKIVNNFNPFAKAAVEILTGRRLYPDIRHPSSIRDNYEYLASSFALDWYYKALTGKPHTPALELSSSVANSQHPEQGAYWFILAKKREFQEQVLGVNTDGFTQTKKGEALYNARAAAQFKDWKLMRKYLRDFYKAGGTYEGMKSSVDALDPLNGLNETEQMRFIRSLSSEERGMLRRAIKFSERLKARLGF